MILRKKNQYDLHIIGTNSNINKYCIDKNKNNKNQKQNFLYFKAKNKKKLLTGAKIEKKSLFKGLNVI